MTALNYHRCHGRDCEGNHPAKSFTSEPEERRKGWKRCHCPIVASGTLDRVARRKATKQIDWDAAAEMMAPYIAANSWELPELLPPPPPPEPVAAPPNLSDKITVEHATKAYVEAHKDARSAQTTVIGHGQRMETIRRFAVNAGLLYLADWNTETTDQYLAQFDVEPITKIKYRKIAKAFFNWCWKGKGWITGNPAHEPAAIHNRATNEVKIGKQRQPLTNDDLERMYAACQKYDSFKGQANLKWRGEDLADFIAISVHTGLRISNVATFSADRLKGKDEIHIRNIKGGGMIYTVVPLWLAERIRVRAKKHGPLIFGGHSSESLANATHSWRERLNELWARCGKWEIKPVPHRFRHTFVRILLESGRSYADCAELTGDTEAVIRKHYAAWVRGRQERLSKLMRESFADVPVPDFAKPQAPAKVIRMVKRG